MVNKITPNAVAWHTQRLDAEEGEIEYEIINYTEDRIIVSGPNAKVLADEVVRVLNEHATF